MVRNMKRGRMAHPRSVEQVVPQRGVPPPRLTRWRGGRVIRDFLVAATALFALGTTSSPSIALELTMSSPSSSFVQGEPIYVWVDYYNNTDDEIGLPSEWMFGFDVLSVRTRTGEPVRRPGEQVTRGPGGRNQIQRIGPRAHFVFYSNLL